MDPSPDLLFGKIAVRAGYLTEAQLSTLLEQQALAARAGAPQPLGELCQELGLLTPGQIQAVLLAQRFTEIREEDTRLGRLAVRNGFATEAAVEGGLAEQKQEYRERKRLPRRLGNILLQTGHLEPQQLEALLKAQVRLKVGRDRPGGRSRPAEDSGAVEDAAEGAEIVSQAGRTAPMACPSCRSDQVAKCSAVYESGTSVIETQTSTVGVAWAGGHLVPAMADGSTHGVQQSVLAARVAPPGRQAGCLSRGPVIGCFLPVMIILFVAVVTPPDEGTAAGWGWARVVSGLLFAILVLGAFGSHTSASEYNRTEYLALRRAWERKWVCLRCGETFQSL